MLEEALRNENNNPSDTAAAVLNYIQYDLPAGGYGAETRFVKSLFGPLCDRIFGEIQGSSKEGYRHKDGGWLSVQTRWTRESSSVPGSLPSEPIGQQFAAKAHLSSKTSWETDPVVELLGARVDKSKSMQQQQPSQSPPTLIETVSNELESRPSFYFSFPFRALPRPMQEAWLSLIEQAYGMPTNDPPASANFVRLLCDILRNGLENQPDLRSHQLKKSARLKDQQQRAQQIGHMSPRTFASPVQNIKHQQQKQQNNASNSPSTKTELEDENPTVALGMLEYYLLLFIRYPLAAPQKMVTNEPSFKNMLGLGSPEQFSFGETVYRFLFARYLQHFLPYERDGYRYIEFEKTNSYSYSSELFLRVVIALWMDSHADLVTTDKVIQTMQERRDRAGVTDPLLFDLSSSYDLVKTKFATEPPPPLVRLCLRTTFEHLILEPKVASLVSKCNNNAQQPQWCLTNAMTATQQSFYNYIRTTFRNASLHDGKDSPFHTALEDWLIWLEPWNQTQPTSRLHAGKIRFPWNNEPSKYGTHWEPYIAANLYIYTVPLAILLRRARELDFSAKKFEPSCQILRKVFRVYSPAVVHAIATTASGASKFSSLLTTHREKLGKHAPPLGDCLLSSCKNDMHNLLEEVYMQHMKKLRDLDIFGRMTAQVEGIFGRGAKSGEEKSLEALVERAKLIVGLPPDYQVFSNVTTRPVSVTTQSEAEATRIRTKEGLLTDYGRTQVILGKIKRDSSDLPYVGDIMHARVRSHEIELFVTVTVWVSEWLNHKFKLGKGHWRFNLRFLADYRNVIFIWLLYQVAKFFYYYVI